MNLLELAINQHVKIENVEYKIINKVKFNEKASYWIEYKLQNIQNSQMYYLNVEISSKAILYKILNTREIQLKMNMIFENEEYELFEKGKGRIETYSGMTDVALNDEVDYYEYNCKNNKQKILSIEKWKDETEISIGKIISLSKIKVLKKVE